MPPRKRRYAGQRPRPASRRRPTVTGSDSVPAAATLTPRPVSQTSDFTESQAARGARIRSGPRLRAAAKSFKFPGLKKCSISMGIFGVSKKTLCPASVILPEYVVLLCSIIYWPIRSFVLSGSCTFFRWPLIVPHVALICLQKKCQHQVQ